jgi:hypothetical protein
MSRQGLQERDFLALGLVRRMSGGCYDNAEDSAYKKEINP